MADVLTAIEAFITGSGLTGILVTVYQIREQSKESARERLRQCVLTPDFFACLNDLVTLTDLARCWLNVRKATGTGMTTISIGGTLVRPTSTTIATELDQMFTKAMGSNEKALRTGCFFLMPRHIENAFRKLYSETQTAVNKITKNVNDIDEATIQRLELAYTDLSETVKDTLGLSILEPPQNPDP